MKQQKRSRNLTFCECDFETTLVDNQKLQAGVLHFLMSSLLSKLLTPKVILEFSKPRAFYRKGLHFLYQKKKVPRMLMQSCNPLRHRTGCLFCLQDFYEQPKGDSELPLHKRLARCRGQNFFSLLRRDSVGIAKENENLAACLL